MQKAKDIVKRYERKIINFCFWLAA